MNSVTDRIRTEHRDLARVLMVLESLSGRLQSGLNDGDIDRLFDICQYVRVYPDKIHHPKEEQYVFRPLRELAPAHHELLERVQDQHQRCAELTAQLYGAVQGFDKGEVPATELYHLIKAYLVFQYEHMQVEEQEILPLAEAVLDSDIWAGANRAFSLHGDPLFGENIEAGFAALRDRIVHAV